jgi:hypothetical protein
MANPLSEPFAVSAAVWNVPGSSKKYDDASTTRSRAFLKRRRLSPLVSASSRR